MPIRHKAETPVLVVSVITLGLMAGFFWTYAHNVSPALMQLEGEHYATVQSLLNRHVRNPIFFLAFAGAGVSTLLAVVLGFHRRQSLSFWLTVSAASLYIFGVVLFTREFNLPLNAYTESWHPQQLPSDWRATRDAWNSANGVRVITSVCAFSLATLALAVKPASPGDANTDRNCNG